MNTWAHPARHRLRRFATGIAAALLLTCGGAAYAQDCPTTFGASDAVDQDRFGWSAAVDGDIAVIGNLAGNGTAAGAVYIVDLATETELFQLVEPVESTSSLFGYSVAIGSGKVAVGAPAFGSQAAVYVFDAATGELDYELVAPDRVSGDLFGLSLAIDGNILVVGAPQQIADAPPNRKTGQVYTYDLATGDPELRLFPARSAPDGAEFGKSVAIEGSKIVVGAPFDQSKKKFRSGAVYVFDAVMGKQLRRLVPRVFNEQFGSNFGHAVAIEGNTVLVTAYLDDDQGGDAGAAYLFDVVTGEERHKFTLDEGEAGDAFGASAALGEGLAFVYRPRIYVFDALTGERRSQLPADPLQRSVHDDLGWSLATDGNLLLAGAPRSDAHGTDAGEVELFRIDELPNTPIVLEPEPVVTTFRFEFDLPGIGLFVFEQEVVGQIVAEAPLDCKPPKTFQVTGLDLRAKEPEPTFEPAPGYAFTLNEPGVVLHEASPVATVDPDGSVFLDLTVQMVGTLEYESPLLTGVLDLADTNPLTFTLNGALGTDGGPLRFDAVMPPVDGVFELGLGAGNPTYSASGALSATRTSPAYLSPTFSQTQKASIVLDFAKESADRTKFSGVFARSQPPNLGDGVVGVLRIGAFRADVPIDAKGKSPKGSAVKLRLKVKKKKAKFLVSVKNAALQAALAALPAEESLPRDVAWSLTLPDGWNIGGLLEMDGKDKLKADKQGVISRATLKMIKRK